MNRRSLLAALGALCLAGCGDSTGSGRVAFAVRVGGVERADRGPLTFDTEQGWRVTLTDARVALGPIYLNTLAPVVARRSLGDRLVDFFVRPAYAHGEWHLGAGRIVGEVTTQTLVDALDPSLSAIAGGGDGVLDAVQSVEFWYFNYAPMQGAAVRVAGVAEKGADRVPFEGALVIDERLATPQMPIDIARRVRGVPARFALVDGGALTVRVDPSGWFRGADFSELLTLTPGATGAYRFTADDNVGRAFVENVRGTRGMFSASFAPRP
jgi:hypothetical protein